jgi:hypothetical protein
VCGEKLTADAAEECHEGKLKDVLRGYLTENIYTSNADKTAFFYRRYQTR